MHPLSRTKEDAVLFLWELAGADFFAVGLDAWQHGERATESGDHILERVFDGLRRHMWPILGQNMHDALRVLDWAIADLGGGRGVLGEACTLPIQSSA